MVFIAAEEGGEKNIGVDKVLEKGQLEEAREGGRNFMPWVFWGVKGH